MEIIYTLYYIRRKNIISIRYLNSAYVVFEHNGRGKRGQKTRRHVYGLCERQNVSGKVWRDIHYVCHCPGVRGRNECNRHEPNDQDQCDLTA